MGIGRLAQTALVALCLGYCSGTTQVAAFQHALSLGRFAPARPEAEASAAARRLVATRAGQSPFVPDVEKRNLMNLLLVASLSTTLSGIGGPFLYFFYPPVSGGGSSGTIAADANGDVVAFDGWLQQHKPGSRGLVQGLNGDATYLIVTEDAKVAEYALCAICTHLGCVVPWVEAENKFMCPCHGSQYNPEGKVVRGPAPLSLALAHVDDDGQGRVRLSRWAEMDFRTGN